MTYATKINNYINKLNNTNVYAIDVETTLIKKDKYKTIFNSPPKLVCFAYNKVSRDRDDIIISDGSRTITSAFTNAAPVWVGHNISYDLYIAYNEAGGPFSLMASVWDTMLAEYLLTNQVSRMESLEELCLKYGIEAQKEEEVAQLIKSGVCPSTIDSDKLEEYLKTDVWMTQCVFKEQYKLFKARPKAWQVMFINQMIFLTNTLRASCNGMKIDNVFVDTNKKDLQKQVQYLQENLMLFMANDTSTKPSIWNPSSNSDLSVFLYGGTKKWEERVPNGVYKSGIKAGTTKYKIEKKEIQLKPHFSSRGAVDEAAINDMLNAVHKASDMAAFLTDLLKYKDYSKNLNTYFEGYMNFQDADGFISPKFNHGLTPTGRLTCSNPNLQNIKS